MERPAFANRERPAVQSLSKALDVLEAFTFEEPEMALGELSAKLGMAKSTVHKLLHTLVRRGYVVQDGQTRRYRLGLGNWHLGSVAVAPLDVRALAAPVLRHLAALTGEQVTLWVLGHHTAVCVDRMDSQHQLRTYTRLGTAINPAHLASGRCLLAWRSTVELEGMLPELVGTAGSSASAGEFFERLAKIRSRGYDVTDRTPTVHGRGIAAPIRGKQGAAAAAVTVSGPAERFDDGFCGELIPQLVEITGKVSAELGYRARTPALPRT